MSKNFLEAEHVNKQHVNEFDARIFRNFAQSSDCAKLFYSISSGLLSSEHLTVGAQNAMLKVEFFREG